MSERTAEPIIATQDLSVRFDRTLALRRLNLQVPASSIFALLGPNGAGKSTLIKTLLNIRRPTEGSATVLGLPSTELRGQAFQRIGYVSENQELPGWMTLEAFLAYLRPFYPTWDRELERSLTNRFHLPVGRKLGKMSRGQQMKAALLGALAYRPALLLLDEPFSGLDPLARDEFIEGLLDRLAAEEQHRMTVLLSSHDLAEIESFCTHVAYLDDGELKFSEEITSLTQRFREVTVTLDPESSGPPQFTSPPSWLQPESSPATLRFVHSEAVREPLEAQIAALLPRARRIEAEPMALRSIFLALARSTEGRQTEATGGRR